MPFETRSDKFGRQHCPQDDAILKLEGAWVFNLEIVPGKYHFRCPKCHHGFVAEVAETTRHQEGLKYASMQEEVNRHILKVSEFCTEVRK